MRGLLALLLVLAAGPAAAQDSRMLPVPEEIEGTAVFVALPPDAIRAIDEPRFLSGAAAARQMTHDEHVLGLRLGSVARAYPLGFLSSHEIVNDVLGDTPVAVTW